MNTLSLPLGWMFVALSVLFGLGAVPRFARYFYPTRPSLRTRLVAPIIFLGIAGFCFGGAGMRALCLVVVAGGASIAVTQRRRSLRTRLSTASPSSKRVQK